jgi:hypothetical protein
LSRDGGGGYERGKWRRGRENERAQPNLVYVFMIFCANSGHNVYSRATGEKEKERKWSQNEEGAALPPVLGLPDSTIEVYTPMVCLGRANNN